MPARYRKLRKIADGGMAELFLATQRGAEGFERRVVLKQILAPLLADPKFRNMLIDEAHVAMSLHHGNIAQVLDLGQSKGRTFLVLELVDGWDLNHILARVRATEFGLPPELCLYVTAEVCRALAYAHAQARDGRPLGIVHRDISPHNVLVSAEGEVKLTDFGIAKALGRREHTGQGIIKGKLAFMSPEQASGQDLDARSDLFSVGTMLYLLFTGKRPFEAPTDLEIVLRVRQCAYTPPREIKPDLPPGIARLIERAMSRDPKDRYQTGEEMLVDLETAQRTVFRPAGQTELRRWLRELGARDHAVPISQAAPLPSAEEEELDIGDEDIVFESTGSQVDTIGTGARRGKTDPSLARLARAIEDAAMAPTAAQETPTQAARAGATPAPGTGTGTANVGTGTGSRASDFGTRRPGRRWLLAGLLGGAAVGAGVFALIRPRLADLLRGSGGEPPAPPPGRPPVGAPSNVALTGVPDALAAPVREAGPPEPPPEPASEVAPAPPDAAADLDRRDAANGEIDDEDEEALLKRREANLDQVIGEEAAAVEEPPRRAPVRRDPPEPPRARPAPREPAQVKIESRPEGAVVKLGNRVFGRAPLSLRFNPGITYELTFVKSGYQSTKKKFTATGRAGQRVSATLKRKPARRKSFFERLFGR